MKIGIQLYSVFREVEKFGIDAVMGVIAKAGYDSVEFAGFYDMTVDEVKALCEKHGLTPLSAHIFADKIEENLPYIDGLGIKMVYVPYCSKENLNENYAATVESYRAAAKLLTERGVTIGYHNHDQEYANGGDKVADIIADVDGMTSELDIFWVTAAGRKPTELMQKYGDKLSAVHIKEMDARWVEGEDARKYACAIVGEGQSDCAGVVALAKKMGVDTFILEVEGYPCDYEEYLIKSCRNLKAMINE